MWESYWKNGLGKILPVPNPLQSPSCGSDCKINAKHWATCKFGAQHKAGVNPSLSTAKTEAPFLRSCLVTSTRPFRADICKGLKETKINFKQHKKYFPLIRLTNSVKFRNMQY